MEMKTMFYCVFSGFLASMASLCAKFAMGKEESLWLCEVSWAFYENSSQIINNYPLCNKLSVAIRIVFFALMILFNAFMWTTFVKALRYSKTSLQATVTNTAANFVFTALFGQLLFGEFLTLAWWVGSLLIVFGWILMQKGNTQEQLDANTKKFL